MNRKGLLGLVALAVVAILVIAFSYIGGAPDPVAPDGGDGPGSSQQQVADGDEGQMRDYDDGGARRVVDADAANASFDEDALNAARSGFRGRVVNWQGQPMPDCGVRLYRLAVDGLFTQGMGSLMDPPKDFIPDVIAGEVRTESDGTFFIDGVWPRAIFLLLAGIDTDAPKHQVVERTPGPGEIVDLGDIKLANAAVLTGVVLDDQRQPVAGAKVRAADLPGQLASFVPFHTFDPNGYMLFGKDSGAPLTVFEMPPWVERLIDQLPIPQTETGKDGTFRLVGVAPGQNMVAATKPGLVAALRPAVRAKPGQVKDIGKLVLQSGAEIYGEVVDSQDRPVVGAEVIAGPTIPVAPFPVAHGIAVGKTDDKGIFSSLGLPRASKALVAARRGPGHPWVVSESMPIDNDFRVVIPAETSLDIMVSSAVGEKLEMPRFKIVPGDRDEGGAEMMIAGFTQPLDLEGKIERPDPKKPRWRITGLLPGKYMILADAPGHGVAAGSADLTSEVSTELALELPAEARIKVSVFDVEGNPISGATIYARGDRGEITEVPVECGRTNLEGVRIVTEVQATEYAITAKHPAYGMVNGEIGEGESELVLVLQPPGRIEGLILEGGQPPELGKWSVAIVNRSIGDGAMIDMPQLTSPDAEGKFVMTGLQPGGYTVKTMKSMSALSSPGMFMTTMEGMWMERSTPDERVEVRPGEVATVQFEMEEHAVFTGPGAEVTGTVMVNGVPGKDLIVRGRADGRQLLASTDAYGAFDLGRVPVGEHRLSVLRHDSDGWFRGSSRRELWEGTIKVEANKPVTQDIEIETGGVTGFVVTEDGSSFSQAMVTLRGKSSGGGDIRLQTEVGLGGRYSFEGVPAGKGYVVESRTVGGENRMRGVSRGVDVLAGISTDIDVRVGRTYTVSGRIDMSSFGEERPRGMWLEASRRRLDGSGVDGARDGGGGGRADRNTGEFTISDLRPGTYSIRIHAWGGGRGGGGPVDGMFNNLHHNGELIVGRKDIADFVIVPIKKPQ